ncbi:MAG: TetR/AcrR family transcriptional regulator, partial [Muribaculaceae bacterium]|nr:TetR/AcrR family transcriptional regulator [Muribaculaceae bacterium]
MKNKSDIILNSAEELMFGMANPAKDITVDMIAKNAGIGKGSIYYYFKSKEEIMDAVIERSYSLAIREYFSSADKNRGTVEKLKTLFRSILKKEFRDNSENVIVRLHLQDDLVLHHKMMITAIKTVSPILTEILEEGRANGS